MIRKDVLRSKKCIKSYKERHRSLGAKIESVNLLNLPLVKRWNEWILVRNEFPYNKIAENHCLLVPLRTFSEDEEMSEVERQGLFSIKREFAESKDFDWVLECVKHSRTVPLVYHLHCLKLKYRTPLSEFKEDLTKEGI